MSKIEFSSDVEPKVKENSKASQQGIGKVYTGYIIIKDNGRYIWSDYSKSTRLTYWDAFKDAQTLKYDLLAERVTV